MENKNDQILHNLQVNLYSILYLLLTEFENLSVKKKTLLTALGFEPKSFDCRSTDLSEEIDFNVGKSRVIILYWWLSIELLKKYCSTNHLH